MRITLRGVRGSIPVPGPATVLVGGNTTCMDIETEEGDRIIIDGGTGIRLLGEELVARPNVKCTLFLTHTHWDHIQGLPFFLPFFIPGSCIDIYGAFDPVYMKDLRTILAQQMEYCYFPVRESELKASINYINVGDQQPITVGSAVVTPILINHPVLNFGYKIESHGKSFFFTGDYETPANIYAPEDDEFADYQKLVDQRIQLLNHFIEGADAVVADSQYTVEEYQSKKGWGHSTYDDNIALARAASLKKLFFTHHDPNRSDTQLEKIYQDILSRPDLPPTEFFIAKEGTVIDLS